MAENIFNTGKKSKQLLGAALFFALLAGVGTMLYLRFLEKQLKAKLTPPPQSLESVVVASRDLPAGSRIDSSNMSLRKIPRKYVEADSITPDIYTSVKGAVISEPLAQGKVLSRSIVDINLPKDFSGTIRKGYRAVTIGIDTESGISGLIRPGNHIDLFTRISPGKDGGRAVAKGQVIIPVLENIIVLATDMKSARPNIDEFHNLKAEKPAPVYNTLTLEITPKQAALLEMALAKGSLLAMLRNPGDDSGALFTRVSTADLFRNTIALEKKAIIDEQQKDIGQVHRNSSGQLVTADGTIITDPGVHLNNKGQLVTANGTILNGHGFTVGSDGKIYDASGQQINTDTLHLQKNGTLADNHGAVATTGAVKKQKNGFVENSRGDVLLPNGTVLHNVVVDKNGNVRTKDGRLLHAADLQVDDKGNVYLKKEPARNMATSLVTTDKNGVVHAKNGAPLKGWKMGKDGTLYTPDGKKATAADVLMAEKGLKPGKNGTVVDKKGHILHAKDLVTVDKNGIVRTKDGVVLKNVHVGKDGKLYDKNGHLVTAQDVVRKQAAAEAALASQGYSPGKDGTVIAANGKVVHARDLVSVDKNGIVRTKDGVVLKDVHVGKDGKLYDKNGHLVTAQDVLRRQARDSTAKGILLSSVTTGGKQANEKDNRQISAAAIEQYEVEYIIGGSTSDGTAKTFMVNVDEMDENNTQGISNGNK